MNQNKNSPRIKVLFFGTPDFAIPTLQTLLGDSCYEVRAVITQPDRPAGRGKKLRRSPIKLVAEQANIPVFTPTNIKREQQDFANNLEEVGPIDVGIVIAFGQILPQAILEYPQHGCLNLHASLLPRWRGAAPMQHAILAGDAETGVCLMEMESGLDSGPVLAKRVVPILCDTDFGSLHDQLAHISAEIIKDHLTDFVRGNLVAIAQPTEGISYANKIGSNDVVLNWNKPAEQLERQIRAFSPNPGAVTHFQGKRLKILGAQAKPSDTLNSHSPGSVAFLDKDNCEIACHYGLLALKEVQLEGRRAMSIQEFLKGANLQSGMAIS